MSSKLPSSLHNPIARLIFIFILRRHLSAAAVAELFPRLLHKYG